MFAFFASGLALASATSSVRTVQAVGSVAFFVLFFTSGLVGPRDQFPGWLQQATAYQPVTLTVDMFAALWIGARLDEYGPTLLLLLGIGVVAALVVRWTLRWQP
jgi:ABC-type polysaccharide/polyol phosphate export permease